MQHSLARITFAALLAVLALVIIAASLLYQLTQEHERLVSQRTPAYAGQLLAGQISTITGDWSRATQAIAQSPLALRLLQTQDEAERRAQLANIVSLHPDLGEIHILNSDQANGQSPVSGMLSSRQLHMIETARSDKNNTTSLRADLPLLTLTEPVRDTSGAVIGYVLVGRHLDEIRLLFDQSPLIDGYAELQQVNGSTDVLLKRGDEHLKMQGAPAALPLKGTPWRLALWVRPAGGGIADHPFRSLMSIGAVLILLIIAVFGLAHTFANRALQRDLSALTKLFSDITHDRMRKQYPVALKELKNAYQVMYQLGKLMVGKHLRTLNSAETDHLSQVNNRRSFEAKQREVFARVNEGWAHSLLILDIDNFKQVNDTFGHEAGDQLIVQFGKALKDNLRGSDFVARLGGDEFCVIFPNTPLAKANELALRLREKLPLQMTLQPDVLHNVSWSGGLSEYSRHDQSENAALARADQALLDAKRTGRNRTEIKAAA
jgi:diguanylate cyclase (GGDEF)-like protein